VGLQAGHSPALTLAYDATDGTELWATHYLGPAGDEGNFDMAIGPDDAHVFVTGGGSSTAADVATLSYTTGAPLPPPVELVGVVSRKTHGDAGAFDIDLFSVIPEYLGIECRSGGANGDYTLVFTFSNLLTSVGNAKVSSGNGSVSSSNIDTANAHNYIVNLTGVTNAQTVAVSLANVYDAAGNGSSTVSAFMGVLIGDVNASSLVDSGDVFLVRQRTGQAVTNSNFREDVNASGLIDSGDVFLARQQTGTSLR
jgi:hypothetical protein